MLKFFRNIRQQTINSGQMKKYSLYAIGEILLVVIGILIALQINNWNANRKLSNELKSTYRKLISEMESDHQAFLFQKDSFSLISNENAKAMRSLLAQENSVEDINLIRNLQGRGSSSRLGNATLDHFNSTYESIVNSGFIYQFEDSTNKLITNYYALADDIKDNFFEMGNANRNVRDAEKLFPLQYILSTPDSIFTPSQNTLKWMNDHDSEFYQASQYYLSFYIRQQERRIIRLQNLVDLNVKTREKLTLLLE